MWFLLVLLCLIFFTLNFLFQSSWYCCWISLFQSKACHPGKREQTLLAHHVSRGKRAVLPLFLLALFSGIWAQHLYTLACYQTEFLTLIFEAFDTHSVLTWPLFLIPIDSVLWESCSCLFFSTSVPFISWTFWLLF